MTYKVSGQSKSRAKLWDYIGGAKTFVGAAGVGANWTILFNAAATAGDTYTIGGYVFQFVANGSEDSPGDSAGTAADPHLVSVHATPSAANAATNLKTAILAETTTTGAWGFLNPVNSVGCSVNTATITINTFPGTFGNAATWITTNDVTTPPTITNVSDGTALPILSTDHKWNFIDTTGFASVEKQYYYLADGAYPGQECNVLVHTITASDTPTIIGHLTDAATASVEALAATAGMSGKFVWTGSSWFLINEGNGTAFVFDAAT
jgi:hypothetical protein